MKHINITLWGFILLLFSGCKSFVEVDLPASQLTASAVFEDKTTANAAMIQIYAKMRDAGLFTGQSSGLSNLLGNYTDELDCYANPINATYAFYNNILLPSNAAVKSFWTSSYNQLYATNALIEGITKSVKLPTTGRDQLKGEALFTRALIHFYLTNIYGSIPYITTTDYQANSIVFKEPSTAIYTYCIDDLTQAIALLPAAYKSADRTRPNKFAAHALMARVYLYSKQWTKAAEEATTVLNNTSLYPFETNLSKIFLKESTATIWQFAPANAGGNAIEAQTFGFTLGPPPISALSTTQMNAFSSDDQRKSFWTSAVSNGTTTWYAPAKYKSKSTTGSTEYSILIRLSEMYLIRAEARAQSENLIGSKEDLNTIRNTAGLLNTTASTQSEILQAILKERQLEFFTEFGHRFFDLKRFNALDAALSGIKPGWNSFEAQLPVPESELILNKNLLPQNTGY